MSDHLPECPCIAVGVPSCICDNDEECGPQCRHHCICPALHACEQRVNDEWVRDYGGHRAFERGVQAARDAVVALRDTAYESRSPWQRALDAIDALRATPGGDE